MPLFSHLNIVAFAFLLLLLLAPWECGRKNKSGAICGYCSRISVLPSSLTSDIVDSDRRVDILSSRFDMNLALSPNSKYLMTTDGYDTACFLIDGVVFVCRLSKTWAIKNKAVKPDCVSAQSEHFSLLLARSSDVHQSLIITAPQNIGLPALDVFENKVTLVVPLVIDDLSRFSILIYSLLDKPSAAASIDSFLIIVPYHQLLVFQTFLDNLQSRLFIKIIIYKETEILGISTKTLEIWKSLGLYSYAIQMALKLLVSFVVKTEFYICLDADIVLLNDFSLSDIISSEKKAIFHYENRFSQHPDWWYKAEKYLNISSRFTESQGFGVTPAILSTYTSKIVSKFAIREYDDIARLYGSGHSAQTNPLLSVQLFESNDFWERVLIDTLLVEEVLLQQHHLVRTFRWLLCFGKNDCLWSEYTLYRLVADHVELFDDFHIPEDPEKALLHCGNVWYREQLPWRPLEAVRELSRDFPFSKCLFSVIQSSAVGVSSQSILSELQHYQSMIS